MHPAPVLSARGLLKTYGGTGAQTRALDGVDLDIARADSIAVMGPSGCGKTTLLHILAGILTPTSGTVHHDGTDLAALGDRRRTRLRRSDFGFVFQDGQLLPELTALENVILPRMLGGPPAALPQPKPRPGWTGWAWQACTTVVPPSSRAGRRSGSRSPGRWPAGPRWSSPTSPPVRSTRPPDSRCCRCWWNSCQDSGAALVMVTHDAKVAAVCRRTVAMRDGRIDQEFVRPAAADETTVVGR